MAADFPTTSDMDAFLINPTVKMSREYVRRSADQFSPLEINDHLTRREAGKRIYEDDSKGVIREFPQKFVLPREYTSEEEETTTSPSDNDDSAFGSTSSEGDTDSIYSYDDLDVIDEEGELPQGLPLCSKAEPVYIISAGRAKVVSVSSSAESSPRSIPPEFESSFALFGSSKTYQRAQLASNFARPRSPKPRQQPKPRPSYQSNASLPRLDATPTSGPTLSKHSQTPLASQRAELGGIKQDPFPANWPLPPSPISPASPVIPKRRMPRLFTATNNPRRKISNASDSSAGSSDAAYSYIAPRSNPTTAPSRPLVIDTTSRATLAYDSPRRQKMVPRGAGERAPTMTLPPCPNDGQWPLRPTLVQQDQPPLKDPRRKSAVTSAQF